MKNKKVTKINFKLKIKILTALGSIIIFFSWVTQNFLQDKWNSEVIKLERNKLSIGFNEINKNIYQIYLNSEQSHASTDSNYVDHLDLGFFAYATYANGLQYLAISSASDDKEFLKQNEDTYKGNINNIKMWNENGEHEKILDFAEKLNKWESENGPNTIALYQSRITELREKVEFWNKIYLALYILGALFFSLAFMIDFKLTKAEPL